jgi:DNA-binding SARP family transcriptional activator
MNVGIGTLARAEPGRPKMQVDAAVTESRVMDATADIPLIVSLFDAFSLTYGGRPILVKNKKAQALFAYLALSSSPSETRERLCGLLWSESEEQKARASLRQTLHQIRETLDEVGLDAVSISRDEVRIDKSKLNVDVWNVAGHIRTQVHPLLLARKHLPERLLPDFDEIDPAFRSWLLVQRQSLHDTLERELEDALAAAGSDLALVKQRAQALLNLDPTHEVACRRLIQVYAEQGDVASALKTYKALWDLLDSEYDIEPSQQTKDLIVELKKGTPVDEPRPPAAPTAKFAMSVAAFELSGLRSDNLYIVNGFRHELIACLVRFREWYVRDAALKPKEASALSVPGYHIEASALEAEGGVRLILTLRESGSDVYVWSDRYHITLANWFETQQAVVRRIAVALNVHLSAERLERVARDHDTALQVYDRWLRGQALIQNYNPSDWHRAADIFKEIIKEVPEFAPAYSSLVQLYNSVHLVHPGIFRNTQREQQALELAKAAVKVDPIDSRSQLCLVWAHAMAKQYAQAELNLGLAHDLNENDPWTLNSSAQGFAYCGALERARRSADQALELSLIPSPSHWSYQVGTRFLCGDYEGCINAADRAAGTTVNLSGWKASALYHVGRRDEAVEETRQFIERMQSQWFGSEPPTRQAVTRWFLHLFPIKEREGWERLRDGLAGAGAPVAGIRHHEW